MEFITHSPEETEAIGEKLAKNLAPGTVLAYRGTWGLGRPPSPGAWPGGWGIRTA